MCMPIDTVFVILMYEFFKNLSFKWKLKYKQKLFIIKLFLFVADSVSSLQLNQWKLKTVSYYSSEYSRSELASFRKLNVTIGRVE